MKLHIDPVWSLICTLVFFKGKILEGNSSEKYLHRKAQVDLRNSWPHRGQLVHIECRAYYEGVRHDVKNKLGLVQFEVQID